jgi:hypothetical protein
MKEVERVGASEVARRPPQSAGDRVAGADEAAGPVEGKGKGFQARCNADRPGVTAGRREGRRFRRRFTPPRACPRHHRRSAG